MTPPPSPARPATAPARASGVPSTAAAVNDPARLAALRATGVLDAPSDAVLDRLARHAQRLLAAPVALVTLVDEHRQFFSSCPGLPEPWASARETPLSQSICQFVVAARAPLVIDDTRRHALVHDHPAVHGLNVAAYAGVPITAESGSVLGSFCVVDVVPRAWSPADLEVLTDLAAAVSAVLDLRVAHTRLALQSAEMRDLLDHMEEAVVGIDATGRISFTNRAWRDAFGYAPEDVADLHPTELIAPQHRARYRDTILRLLKGEPVRAFEVDVLAADGRRFATRSWAVPRMAPGRDGALVCVGARVGFRLRDARD